MRAPIAVFFVFAVEATLLDEEVEGYEDRLFSSTDNIGSTAARANSSDI